MKQKQITWLRAYIALWNATEGIATGDYKDPANLVISRMVLLYSDFCDRYNLPKISADDLIYEIEKEM